MEGTTTAGRRARQLTWPWFLVVVVVYVAIIQGIGLLIGVDTGDADSPFPTTESIVRNALIPIGLSIAYGVAIATWLGWWGEIIRDDRPVAPWVRRVPITMIVAAIIAINYTHLADQAASLVLCLILLGLFVGFGEELMFRGIGVITFRHAGMTEGRVALWSSLVFGLVHVSNAISHGTLGIGTGRDRLDLRLLLLPRPPSRRNDPAADARPRPLGLQPVLQPRRLRRQGLRRHGGDHPHPARAHPRPDPTPAPDRGLTAGHEFDDGPARAWSKRPSRAHCSTAGHGP